MNSVVKQDRVVTTVNIRLLVGALVILVAFCVAGYFWNARQVDRLAQQFLDRADVLVQQEEWEEAAGCLFRYLKLRPDDTEARLRLAHAFGRAASGPRKKSRAVELYYRAVGLAPGRTDLRSELAGFLLELKRYAAAEQQAEHIARLQPHSPIAMHVRALAQYHQSGPGGLVVLEEAVRAAKLALEQNPGDVEVAQALADIYRNRLVGAEQKERNGRADAVIDRMVEAAAGNVQALLAAYHYARRYDLAGADGHLVKARELAPYDPSVLVVVGDDALRREAFDEAKHCYERCLEIAPTDPRAFVALGDYYVSQGDHDAAIELWQKGLSQVGSRNAVLRLHLTDALIETERLDEAGRELSALDRMAAVSSVGRSTAQQTSLRRAVDLTRAKWYIARGNQLQAIPILRRVTTTVVAGAGQGASDYQRLQTWLLLGQAHAELRQWDAAATAYERAVVIRPTLLESHLAAARAWAAAGRLETAIEEYERVLKLDDVPPGAWLDLARLKFRHQLRTEPGERDWASVEQSLDMAEQALPESWKVVLLRADVAVARKDATTIAKAVEALNAAEEAHPEVADLWQRLALAYERLGRKSEADRALVRFTNLSEDKAAPYVLLAEVLSYRGEYQDARQVLIGAEAVLGDHERRDLHQGMVRLARRTGRPDEMRRYLLKLVAADPANPEPVWRLAKLALQRRDWPEASRLEKQLYELEGRDGCRWRYCKARRLIAKSESSDDRALSEAILLQSRIETRRPWWPETSVLQAMIVERQGKSTEAVTAYKKAIRLGGHRVDLYERLTQLLYRTGRFEEAEEYLAWLGWHVPFSHQELNSLSETSASSGDKFARAVRLARKAIQHRQHDPVARLWLGHMMMLAGEGDTAGAVYLWAVKLAPRDARTWAGLISYLKTQSAASTSNILNHLEESTSLTEADRWFMLAQGYELNGDRTQAEMHYRMAEHAAPGEADVKIRLARFLRDTHPNESIELLRKALAIDFSNESLHAELVEALATQTHDAQWQQAERLLKAVGTDEQFDPAGLHRRAKSLAERGRPADLRMARRLLEKLMMLTKKASPEDRLLLAQLYEAEGDLEAARRQFGTVILEHPDNPAYQAQMIHFLLRRDAVAEAERQLERLEKTSLNRLETLGARLGWLITVGRDAEVLAYAEAFAARGLDTMGPDADRTAWMAQIGNVLATVGHDEAVERWYRRIAHEYPTGYQHLAHWLLVEDRTSGAVKVCMRAAERKLTADVVTLLAKTLTFGRPTAEDEALAEPIFARAVEEFDEFEDATMLFAIGNLRLKQDRTEEAIVLLRRTTTINPGLVMAWNNLAASLAEQPGEQNAALECIDRAIEAAGSDFPTLIDTKAMVLVHRGRQWEAISLLEGLVASSENIDARYYFHLSIAYQQTGAYAKARLTLERARALGLAKKHLSQREQTLLAELEERFS